MPYSQLLRIRKICSSLMDFDKHALVFASHFQNRGYPIHLIDEGYVKARRMDRNHLLDKGRTPKNLTSENNTILVSTYHPSDLTVPKIISSNCDFLGKKHNTTFLHKKHVMNAFCRAENIQDILVSASTSKKLTTNLRSETRTQAKNLALPTTTLGDHKFRIEVFFKPNQKLTNLTISLTEVRTIPKSHKECLTKQK